MAPDPLNRAPLNSPPRSPGPVVQFLRATSRALATAADRLEAAPRDRNAPLAQQVQDTIVPALTGITRPIAGTWQTGLSKIRRILPRSLNQRMSDWGLTGAIVATVLLISLITPLILFPPPPPTVIAVNPELAPDASSGAPSSGTTLSGAPSPGAATPETASSDSGSSSSALSGLKNGPAPNAPRPFLAPLSQPLPQSPSSGPDPSASPTDSASSSASAAAQPAPLPSSPPLSPPLKLSPEQKLIASIQDQITAEIDPDWGGLIQSVQANFRSSLLRVNLASGWYNLSPGQQDQLANAILARAQGLNFLKLELWDDGGDRLARSPVVGSEMILLKRETTA